MSPLFALLIALCRVAYVHDERHTVVVAADATGASIAVATTAAVTMPTKVTFISSSLVRLLNSVLLS